MFITKLNLHVKRVIKIYLNLKDIFESQYTMQKKFQSIRDHIIQITLDTKTAQYHSRL